MKYAQRLDYARLAEVIHERGLMDVATVRELMQASSSGGTPFPEAVVEGEFVSDWELSRIVAEIFNLPFLPVDFTRPNASLLETLDRRFLIDNLLVPVSQFGNVLTLAMPALVQADVLGRLSAENDLVLIPVVGSVATNKRWIKEHCSALEPTAGAHPDDADWTDLFDAGDAAVQMALDGGEEIDEELAEALEGGDVGALEFTDPPDLEDIPSLTDGLNADVEQEDTAEDGEPLGLPPLPNFGA